MIELEFIDAAQTVTESKHLLRTSRASVLLDCGLFQGQRKETDEKNRKFSIDHKKLDAIVLSYAHTASIAFISRSTEGSVTGTLGKAVSRIPTAPIVMARWAHSRVFSKYPP